MSTLMQHHKPDRKRGMFSRFTGIEHPLDLTVLDPGVWFVSILRSPETKAVGMLSDLGCESLHDLQVAVGYVPLVHRKK